MRLKTFAVWHDEIFHSYAKTFDTASTSRSFEFEHVRRVDLVWSEVVGLKPILRNTVMNGGENAGLICGSVGSH